MADFILGFRELALNEVSTQKWKEISVNTGATQGTLQDIKRTEGSGWYSYRDSNKGGSVCRNRFIYWRISHDTLELVEQSFDIDLRSNQVRLHFQDSPVLDGVSVHETSTKVVILVPTVSSVHRIVLPHPYKLHPQDYVGLHNTVNVAHSVFSDISSHQLRDQHNFHVINHLSVSGSIPQRAASWLTPSNGAFFGLASNSGSILLIQMPPQECQGAVIVQEFRQSSVMQRMWTGIVPAAIRGVQDATDTPVDLCFHTLGQDLYIFALGRDCKLRMWSVKDQECVSVTDLLEFVVGAQFGKLQQSGRQHLLRKKAGNMGGMLTLGVYLNFVDTRQFMFLQPVFVAGQYQLMHLNNVYAPQYELVDFCLTSSHVWALWSHHDSDYVLRYTAIDGESYPGGKWISVTLKSYSKEKLYLPEGFVDPREFYLQHIFHPGRFSVNTITRAVNVKRRPSESSFLGDTIVPISALKNEVVGFVENEIQTHASEYEVDDEDYYDLQVSCWSTFYRCCLQYQQVGNTFVGLGVDQNTGLICLIKKTGFSILRPRDLIECLLLSPRNELLPQELALIPFFSDAHVCRDLIALFDSLTIIHELFTPVLNHAVAHDLVHQQSPENIMRATFMEFFSDREATALIHELDSKIGESKRLVPTLKMLLQILDLAKGAPQELAVDNAEVDPSRQLLCSRLFAGPLGVLLISGSVRQLARLRFELCLDLLVLLLLLDHKPQIALSSEDRAAISEVLISQCSVLAQAYFSVMWLSDTAVTTDLPSMVDFGLGKLASLAISDGERYSSKNKSTDCNPCTVLDMFVQGEGGTQTLLLLAQSEMFLERSNHMWAEVLQTLVTITAQIVWPISVNFSFPEFMLTKGLYSELQEYVRLLQSWCEWNSSSRKFLSGQCYLALGEPDKAVDRFKEAAEGVTRDEFLVVKVLQTDETEPECLAVLYFLKVIRQFEQLKLLSHVISLATTAIEIASKDNPNLPALWSMVFACNLALGHNDKACAAMISNPNAGRRSDCLRQLVVVLFERRQLESLIRFSYSDLLDEVLQCIEQRARSADITVHNYYDLLYAFHIFRSNYRKAASAMYECALRIAAEFPALAGLKQRAKCLLASMNCFRLVDPKFAWIVKPLPKGDKKVVGEDEMPFSGTSPKRSHDGEEFSNRGLVRHVEILELCDIEKEYELVLARLRLVKKSPQLSTEYLGPQYTASETVTLLLNAGLYDVAAHICTRFNIPMHALFESLTSRCVKLSHVVSAKNLDPDYVLEACDALAECDTSSLGTTGNVADKAWRLLESYLNKYEEDRQSVYSRCVATRLLQMNASLPTWLVKSYKKRNAPELMHVYLERGHLGEVSALVVEYIDAVLGSGRDNFHLKNCLHGTTAPVWMPYTVIDRLLFALEDQRGDPHHDEAYQEVAGKLRAYEDVLGTASQDVICLAAGTTQHIRIVS